MAYPVNIVRGRNKVLRVTIYDSEGNPYTLGDNETLRFGVKESAFSSSYLITKTTTSPVTGTTNVYEFSIAPSDTASLDFGKYAYDIGLQSGSSSYYDVIQYSPFVVTYNVTGVATS